ncbi:integrase core domain-containing protein [Mucilaginibacter sp. OK098]|uniref:integrase core domain-containing protein n=1 Tax=Mucilaginibacter sp. OK098 TaxID=1855297 RepID=UPI00091674F9|nr:integrase core domain-containing protein [Mucilaginibacter sp. OK098]SHM75438.1 Integrase core domain-containing protein [Mucilaginibacter sp. OK098]
MPIKTNDNRFQQRYLDKYHFMIKEYELVKSKQHPKFKFAKEFYHVHDTDPRNFLRYYNRFKQSGKEIDLLPGKRGPKYRTRRPIRFIENKVLELREKGNSKLEIVDILKPKLHKFTPSASGVYNILKRYQKNRLTPKLKQNKRKIIKERMGQLGHIDCHHLSKSVIRGQNRKLYLACLLDDYSKLAWAEVTEDITALSVMFAALKCMNYLNNEYSIKFEEIISDNGPEFGPAQSKKKHGHPFERLLIELDIKHRYTRPYRPQTNGKVERFWRTLKEDLIHETDFDSLDELKDELLQYLVYYNNERPHQGIDGKKPSEMASLNNKK